MVAFNARREGKEKKRKKEHTADRFLPSQRDKRQLTKSEANFCNSMQHAARTMPRAGEMKKKRCFRCKCKTSCSKLAQPCTIT